MATRIISASNTSANITLSDGDSYTFSGNPTSDAPVANGTVTGISINFDRMRHFSNDYYLVVYVGGIRIGETDRVYGNRDYYTTVSHTMSFDTADYSSQYFANALTATGSITVKAYENGSADESFNIRSGCECTIYVYYDAPTLTKPGKPTISQEGTNYVISWSAATGTGGNGYVTYDVLVDGDVYMWSAGSTTKLTHAIPSEYYGVSVSFSVRAYYNGTLYTYSESEPFVATLPSVGAPSNLLVNGVSTDEGKEAALTWIGSSLSFIAGDILYTICINGSSYQTTYDTYYTISESELENFEGTLTITVYASAGGYSSGASNSVTFVIQRNTVKYYTNNGFVECLVHYYTSDGWVDCIPHYYTNSSFVDLG